jgi:hypothetical protein
MKSRLNSASVAGDISNVSRTVSSVLFIVVDVFETDSSRSDDIRI